MLVCRSGTNREIELDLPRLWPKVVAGRGKDFLVHGGEAREPATEAARVGETVNFFIKGHARAFDRRPLFRTASGGEH